MNHYITESINKQKNSLKLLNNNYSKMLKLFEENNIINEKEIISTIQENECMLSEMINNTEEIIYDNHKINSKSKKEFNSNKKLMEVFYPYMFMLHTMISNDDNDINQLRTIIGNVMIETSK